MDPIEFCKLKHGTCACEKNGKANCAQVVRQAADQEEIRRASQEKMKIERERQSRYIQDEWSPRIAHGAMISEALRRYRDSSKSLAAEMFRGIEAIKETPHETIARYCKEDTSLDWDSVKRRLLEVDLERRVAMFDYKEIKDPIRPISERRLGSSDKPHVKFMKDPVKRRPI